MLLEIFSFKIDWLTIFGLGAQFLFLLRFIYQWVASEKRKQSIIPIEFWYFSIFGGILIIIYAYLRKDLVFFIGQIFALFIYLRNLMLFNLDEAPRQRRGIFSPLFRLPAGKAGLERNPSEARQRRAKGDKSNNQKKYETNNPLKKFFLTVFLNNLKGLVNSLEIKKVLDVGCGEGQVIFYLNKFIKNAEFTGVDISDKAIELAKRRANFSKFIPGDINNLDNLVKGKKFDLVMVLEVLEHFKEPKKIIETLKKVNTNYYVFSVPNEPWFSLGNLLTGKNISRLGQDIDHQSSWSKNSFTNFLSRDFIVLKVINSFFWIIVLVKKNE